MGELYDALDAYLTATGPRIETLADVLDAFDGSRNLVEFLAGTDDRRSRSYKSARDRVSRWRRGGRNFQRAPDRQRIIEEARRRAIEANPPETIDMAWRADIRMSQRWQLRTVPAPPVTQLVPVPDDLLAAWARGDVDDTEERLQYEFFEAYGSGQPAEIGGIEWVQIE